MKPWITLLIFSVITCTPDYQKENNDLLTSTSWIADQNPMLNGEMPKFQENHSFRKDGSYLQEGAGMKVTGTWKWTSKNEIYVALETIAINGREGNFDKKQNYYIRILEVSENNLKTLERFETDSWDSGFAYEKNYRRI